ncbi:hypothetical protein F2Q70_00004286 [Brassica cretica]|uniref:Uncharacterized protein n=1 Tax=Brassica cretica TaxID=69181 RepID=A0A8S9IP14_BRACR|nr:hypothetical protein F2Q70_00004286 [Brassica cretica]
MLSIGGGLSVSIDGWLSLPIDFDINRAGRMWVSCCELFFWLKSVDRCLKSDVDRHQCDPPKLIELSTSKSPSCGFSCFTICQNSAIRQAGPVQFGGWPSWIERAISSAIRRAGPVQFGGWPSWDDRVVLVLSAILLSQDCIELALVSYRSELPLELYNKNCQNSSSRIKFMVFV